ncbi:MAG TPA: PLP-dependent aspartate aminotransferase family protein [Gaiellaceae bacterium]|nr:PLP-dependent aspartate aminotransferase family protein [Gaiellaceae bacterium]
MSVDRATIWPYRDGELGPFYYQRDAHPTGAEAERELGRLDGGHALLFSSGTGAATAVVLAFLSPGETIALAEGAYFGTSVLFRELERWGLRHVEFDQTGPPPDGADLVWLEAPSNPFLTMPDLEAAAAHPARVLVDATAATPVFLRPLDYGADFVLHSATKYLAGHDDALLGVVVCKREDDSERLHQVRTRTGIAAAPDPAYLLLRGLATLEVRVRRQTETATELARLLDEHPAVQTVRYAGIGGLLSFDVVDADAARHVETSLQVIANATSLGGVHSVLEARARWEPERVPPGLLRLSVGLEPVDELWHDLEQALASG